MTKRYFIVFTLINIIFFANFTHANVIEFNKPIIAFAVMTNHHLLSKSENAFETKKVYLMNFNLTPEQKAIFLSYHIDKHKEVNYSNIVLPKKVYIGMNGTPVLDQGMHGSCVTFANTGALDAMLGKGDYISQLCTLALGSYFAEKGPSSGWPLSGWNGATSPIILDRLLSFGFINKTYQKIKSCGGFVEYPLDNTSTGIPLPLDIFHSMPNEDLVEQVDWAPLLTFSDRLSNPSSPSPYDGDKILFQVKQFLALSTANSKDTLPQGLITFGVLLPNVCYVGACAQYHEKNDSWVITKSIANIDPVKDRFTLGGHEMIIMGYNDEAIAIDNEGTPHQGLFFIRNSWGEEVGDHGNYYMTYDFFKKFVVEVQMIYRPKW